MEDFDDFNFKIPYKIWYHPKKSNLKAMQPFKWLDVIYIYDNTFEIIEETNVLKFKSKKPKYKEINE
jgi:hypothetical protein